MKVISKSKGKTIAATIKNDMSLETAISGMGIIINGVNFSEGGYEY